MINLDDLDNDTVIPRNVDEHAIDVDDVIPQDDPTEESFDTLTNAEVSINVGNKHTLDLFQPKTDLFYTRALI